MAVLNIFAVGDVNVFDLHEVCLRCALSNLVDLNFSFMKN